MCREGEVVSVKMPERKRGRGVHAMQTSTHREGETHTVISACEVESVPEELLHKRPVVCVLQVRVVVRECARPQELNDSAVRERVEVTAHHQGAPIPPLCKKDP